MNLSSFTQRLSGQNISSNKKKDPIEEIKKAKKTNATPQVETVDYSSELKPNRTETKLEQVVQQGKQRKQEEQNYNLVNSGEFTAREYTNANGQKVYTQAPQNQQPQLGDMSQQPTAIAESKFQSIDPTDKEKFETGQFAQYDADGKLTGFGGTRNAKDPKPVYDRNGDFAWYEFPILDAAGNITGYSKDGRSRSEEVANKGATGSASGSSSSSGSNGSSGGNSGSGSNITSSLNTLLTGDYTEDELWNKINQDLAEGRAGAEFYGVLDQLNITNDKKDLIKRQVELNNDMYDFNIAALVYMEEDQLQKLEQYQEQVEGALGANRANLSQSREGVQASSAQQAMGEYETAIKKDLEKKFQSFARSQEQYALTKREYELAKENGDTDLAKQLGAQLSLAQDQLYEAETRVLDSNERWVSQLLTQGQETRQQLSAFTNMIADGQQFDQQGLMNMASTLGLPTDMVMSTYQSYETIRNDKTMDQQQKALALGELARDTEMRANGYMSEQQQSAKMFTDMYSSGSISKEQLGEMMQVAGIDSMYNPVAIAENEMKKIEIAMQRKILNGEPITPQDRLAQYEAIQQMKALGGTGAAYLPASTKGGVNVDFNGGGLEISLPSDYEEWCGRFVNDFFGKGVMADEYSQKKSLIDIPMEDAMADPSIVVPGMAFVMGYTNDDGTAHPNGHTGIVMDITPDGYGDYDVSVAETNRDGAMREGVKTGVTNYTEGLTYKLSRLDGFVSPPGGTLKAGANAEQGQGGLLNEFKTQGKAAGLSGEALEKFAEKQVLESFEPMSENESKSFTAYTGAIGEEQVLNDYYSGTDFTMEEYADNINVLTREIKGDGLTAEIVNRSIDDPGIRRAVLAEMRWINSILRKESGAAISAEEYSSMGTQYFPRAGDDQASIADKQRGRDVKLKGLRGTMGPAGLRMYNEDFVNTSNNQPAMDADSLIEKYNTQNTQNTIQTEKTDYYSLYDIN